MFRDALRSNPLWHKEYADLKVGLAGQLKENRAIYTKRKGNFVELVRRSYLLEKKRQLSKNVLANATMHPIPQEIEEQK